MLVLVVALLVWQNKSTRTASNLHVSLGAAAPAGWTLMADGGAMDCGLFGLAGRQAFFCPTLTA